MHRFFRRAVITPACWAFALGHGTPATAEVEHDVFQRQVTETDGLAVSAGLGNQYAILGGQVGYYFQGSLPGAKPPTYDNSTGFVGDVLTSFRNALSGSVSTFWRVRFGEPSQAVAARSDIGRSSQIATTVVDRDVVIAARTDPTGSDWSVSELSWEPAEPEDYASEGDAFASLLAGDAITCVARDVQR